MRTLKEKALLEAMAGIRRIVFKNSKNETMYLLYNEMSIGEAEAEECVDKADFDNPNVVVMTKAQFNNLFLIDSLPEPEMKKAKKKSELAQYREFKKAKKAGLLDDMEYRIELK